MATAVFTFHIIGIIGIIVIIGLMLDKLVCLAAPWAWQDRDFNGDVDAHSFPPLDSTSEIARPSAISVPDEG